MVSDDLAGALGRVNQRFDLNEYETDAYLVVLEHGRLTASEIADRTDIPQPRVYDTVRSLAERGLVELRESRPIEVLAVDPEAAFEGVHDSLDALVGDLRAHYTAPARDAEAASLVKSRSTILRHIESVIAEAEYELILSLTPDLVARFEEKLADRHRANVATELLVTSAADAPAPEGYDYASIATTVREREGVTTPVVAVGDGEHAVYATQDALAWNRERYGVVFDRSELGFLVSGFFNTLLWSTADPVLDDGEDLDFPRRYASIRRCVADLDDGEGSFTVAIEGRDTATGEPRSISGRVVGIARDETGLTAALTVATDDGEVTVGGRVAAFEDVEAHELRVERA
ncbi:HTH-type sugar sensing transcriptional regulator TrmB [Halococcus agarilyticus]|uniref:HTH-type sugar sensing transcriptional regulator TrmB n=1 Tax=Halococcus agarilyticus TaxID=1232219 RepID=UPI0006778CC4|nr:TrmB family transcriptional regulator [Halococcus agarilyticus]